MWDVTFFTSDDGHYAYYMDLRIAECILADMFSEKEILSMSMVHIDAWGKKYTHGLS